MGAEKSGPRFWLGTMVVVLSMGVLASVARGSQQQVWVDYNPGWKVSEITRMSLDLGVRQQLEDQGYTRLVLTPGVDFKVKKWKLTAGLANYYTLNQGVSDRWEIRPYQSASTIWPNRRISLDHRVRLEERFDFNTTTWDSRNSLRGRYRLRFRYRLAALQRDQFWSLLASGELFYTFAGQEGQQQETTKASLGAERTFKHGRRLRFEVVWQQQGLIYDPENTADVIYFRFRFLKSW